MPRVTHFEHMYDDPEKVIDFYKNIFGWSSEVWKGGDQLYWMITTGPDSEVPGINGGFMNKPPESTQVVVNTVTVENIDETIKMAEEHGAKVAMAKMPIMGVGYQAYLIDPGGVVFGVHQMDEFAK